VSWRDALNDTLRRAYHTKHKPDLEDAVREYIRESVDDEGDDEGEDK
jgi:hypothetical protein